jgi:hypothetical protein
MHGSEYDGALRASSVHYGEDILGPLLDRRQIGGRNGIGEAHTALVEDKEPAERRQAPEEVGDQRFLPLRFHMGVPTRDEVGTELGGRRPAGEPRGDFR